MKRTRVYSAASLALMLIGLTTLTTQTPAHGEPSEPDFSLASIRSGRATISDVKTDDIHRTTKAGTSATDTGEQLGVRLVESASTQGVANLSLLHAETGTPVAAAVGHEQGVTLSWDVEQHVAFYVVTRDEDKLGETEDGVFIDSNAPIGELLDYRIEPVTADGAFAVSHGVEVIRPTAGEEVEAAAEMVRLSSTRFQSWVTWKSFIRQQFLDSPGTAICDYSTSYKFGGDNRGFTNGYPYRTMVQAVVNWNNNGSMAYQKAVGATKVYRKSDGALVNTKTASSSKITAQRLAQSTGTRVELYFTKHATNPFCTKLPNAIEGYLRIAVTRAGAYSVLTGRHLQMPPHEIYVGDQNQKTVYTRSEYSPICLQKIACPAAYITGSGSYS